jgi:MoaA/NifB/PqqE/SkfB family radical SAM enzyme
MCNSKCLTCNIWDFYNHYPEKIKEEIKLDEFEKTIDKIRENVLWLTLGGGEPTLRKDFSEFVEISSNYCKNLGLISVPTNGLNPKLIERQFKDAIDKCNEKIDLFATVSIDGLGKLNDEIRGIESSLKKSTKTLEKLKKLEEKCENFHVGVQTTISKFNVRKVKDLFCFFSGRDIPVFFTFAVNGDVYRNRGLNVSPKGNKKLFEILDFIENNIEGKDLKSFLSKIYLKLSKKFFLQKKGETVVPCYASYSSLTINAFMDVRACDPYSSVIGNLRENNYNILNILKSKRCKEIRERINNKKCPGCWISCEAYPTILQNFPHAIILYLRKKNESNIFEIGS